MDLLTHTVLGASCGAALSAPRFGRGGDRAVVVWLTAAGAIGALLPDLDTFSLWPQALTAPFGLPAGREVFFGQAWYSHRGAFHSLAAVGLFGLLAAGLAAGLTVWTARFRRRSTAARWLDGLARRVRWRPARLALTVGRIGPLPVLVGVAVGLGGLSHLLADLTNPAGAWGGLPLLWPLPIRFGGWGWTWWSRNYDLFLIALTGLVAQTAWLLGPGGRGRTRRRRTLVPTLGLTLVLAGWGVQLARRGPTFNDPTGAVGYAALDARARAVQQRDLGQTLCGWMEAFGRTWPLMF